MVYALDTNIISFLLRKDRNQEVAERFEFEINKRKNYYVIPPLCYYETFWYLLRKKAVAQLRIFNGLYANSLTIIGMSEAEFIKAAEIRAYLDEKGKPIGDGDIFTAAYCIVNGYTLVTNNIRHFEIINELKFDNWKSDGYTK